MVRGKVCHTFGLAGGRHRLKRKSEVKGRPRYRFVCSLKRNTSSSATIKIKRKKNNKSNCDRSGSIGYSSKPSSSYSFMRTGQGLKYKICKIARDKSANQIFNLDKLQQHVTNITLHSCQCEPAIALSRKGKSPIKLVSQITQLGLASIIVAMCNGCNASFPMETSDKIRSKNSSHFDINIRAVWGCMVTGNGCAHLNEILGTMDMPGMKQDTFAKIESEISEWWKSILQEEMLVAGVEERNHAIENECYHQGVPGITVVTDGGWSKRSHKHSYNALGGVAIIIGYHTKKLLYVGIRNKYCYICNRAKTSNNEPPEHVCFRNWEESSQAMESDAIVEGFKQAEQVHGLRYTKVIADGDSSVFAKIQEEVPVWGKDVTKLECANHVCKCLRSSLEKLVAQNPQYKGKNKLSKSVRIRLVSAVRCAIRMRSKDVKNKREACTLLSHDIRNSIFHIFGNHTNCSDFCKASKTCDTTHTSTTSETNSNEQEHEDDEIQQCIEQQAQYWTDGSSLCAQQESRNGTTLLYKDLDKQLLADITILLNRVASKTERLLGNVTTNLAEAWMHIRSKFDDGKVLNLCNRGSWHARCYGAAVRQNLGTQWAPHVWGKSTGTTSGFYFDKLYAQRHQALVTNRACTSKPQQSCRRWKRKLNSNTESAKKKARREYGPEAVDVVNDLTPDALERCKSDYFEKHINLSDDKIDAIEIQTREQSNSQVWRTERRKRITASNFGKVIKRNPKLPVKPLIQNLLYSNFTGNSHTLKGIQDERITVQEYTLKKAEEGINITVESCGLMIDKQHKFIAASPDGLVTVHNDHGGERGLLEVKNLIHNKPINLTEATRCTKNFCLEDLGGKLSLKPNHPFYYQCQGQLHVSGLPWLDFVVRTTNPYQLHIERIWPDVDLWKNIMLPKLKAFYCKVILSELASPRDGKYPGIREPGIWYSTEQPVTTKRHVGIRKRKPVSSSLDGEATQHLPSCHPSSIGSLTCDDETGTASTLNASTSRNKYDAQHLQPSSLTCDGETGTASTLNASTSSTSNKYDTRHRRPSRRRRQKFIGRHIAHYLKTDENKGTSRWYHGTVLELVRGVDGEHSAVYDILYDKADDPCEVNHLVEDFEKCSVKFLDL